MRRSPTSSRSRSARSSHGHSGRTAGWRGSCPTCVPNRQTRHPQTRAKEAPMSDDDLTPAERAEIERVHGVLAEPAVWAEPPLDLQERVVAAIAEEAGVGRRRRRIRYALVAVAAAVVLAAGVTVGLQATRDEPVQFAAPLTGTRLAPHAAANATLTKTNSGWKIELHATGLPRRTDGEFYE